MHSESTVIGFLGGDPRRHSNPDRKTFATFSLASHRYARDGQGQTRNITTWHDVVAWEKTAEDICRLLHKGSLVWVRGRIEYRNWKDRKEVFHRTAEIHVDEWKLLDRSPTGEGASANGGEAPPAAPPEAERPPSSTNPRGRKRSSSPA